MRHNPSLRQRLLPIFTLIMLFGLLAGCNLPNSTGVISVWLDVPLDGLVFLELQTINIKGHAAAMGGVSRVEVWINGALLTTINNPPIQADLASFQTEWAPSDPGEYTIQAIAFSADGTASSPDSARIRFGTSPATLTATPIISATPELADAPTITGEPTNNDTPTPYPGATIQFWADPPEIAAGACTTIRWQVENASRVIFGGIDQPFDGSYRDCLCASQRYTLRVINLDGIEDRRTVDIAVTGSCITPTSPPPADTTPPPAPTPAAPADGLSISCKASQSLTWLPVNDPSGIAEYQVEVQRHAGDNNWQPAPGGALTGIQEKQTSIPVECGWYYRWRVRAVDGAGNVSPWSGWWHFSITLI